MTITELIIRNFKAQDVVQPLTGLDIFIGPNGIGKSSRPEALALSMLGYVPGRGKQPAETMKLASADEMTVGLATDTGFSFERNFTRSRKTDRKTGAVSVSVSESLNVSPSQGESNNTAKKERVSREIGDFAIHLDFGEFLIMSAAKRREFLYGLVPSSDGWDKERVAEHLRTQILSDDLQYNNPEAFEIAKSLIDKALAEWKPGLDTEAGVLAALEWSKTQQTIWNAKRKDAAGAVRQLADLKNQLLETDHDITERKEELERYQEELIAAEKELSRGQELQEAFDERRDKIEQLQTNVNELKAKVGPPDLSDKQQKLDGLKAQIKDIVTDTSELDKRKDELDAQLKELKLIDNQASAKAHLALVKQHDLESTLGSASKAGGTCVISKLVGCTKDFGPFKEYLKKEIDKYEKEITKANEARSTTQQEIEQVEAKIKVIEQERKDLFAVASAQTSFNESLRNQIMFVSDEIAALERESRLATDRHEAAKQELEILVKTPAKPVPDMAIAEKQAAGIRNNISALKSQIEEKEKARITLSNMQSSMLDNKDAENNYNAAVSLVQELGPKGIQGEILKGGLEPLRGSIQECLSELGITNRFEFRTESDRGQEIFDFGWMAPGTIEDIFVSFDALSTGQRMLVLAAILTALIEKANPPIKVLTIDDFEGLDAKHISAVLAGLPKIKAAGRLDNIILAGVLDEAEISTAKGNGWTITDLGEPSPEVIPC